MIVGRKRDVDATSYLYRYLVREVARLADEAWLNEPASWLGKGPSARSWKNSFRLGAATRIRERLEAQRKATLGHAAEDGANRRALIRLDQNAAAIQDFIDGLNFKRSTAPRCGDAGYGAGREAGGAVNIGRHSGQLGEPAKRLEG